MQIVNKQGCQHWEIKTREFFFCSREKLRQVANDNKNSGHEDWYVKNLTLFFICELSVVCDSVRKNLTDT